MQTVSLLASLRSLGSFSFNANMVHFVVSSLAIMVFFLKPISIACSPYWSPFKGPGNVFSQLASYYE